MKEQVHDNMRDEILILLAFYYKRLPMEVSEVPEEIPISTEVLCVERSCTLTNSTTQAHSSWSVLSKRQSNFVIKLLGQMMDPTWEDVFGLSYPCAFSFVKLASAIHVWISVTHHGLSSMLARIPHPKNQIMSWTLS